jgi:hypothetical protein
LSDSALLVHRLTGACGGGRVSQRSRCLIVHRANEKWQASGSKEREDKMAKRRNARREEEYKREENDEMCTLEGLQSR